jgi:hypothetical protein
LKPSSANEKSEARPSSRKITVSQFSDLGLFWSLPCCDGLVSPVMGRYGTHETQPWLASAVAMFTAAYGILMLLLWPDEEISPISPKQKPE